MEIFCQKCDTVILIDKDQFGISQECPACGHPLKLPSLPEPIHHPPEAWPQQPSSPQDHARAEEMLREPASEHTRVWRKKLAAAFQAANHFAQEPPAPTPDEEDEPLPLVTHLLNSVMPSLRIKKTRQFDRYYAALTATGSFCVLLLALLTLFHAIVLTVKIDALYLVVGIQAVVAMLVFNLFAAKFCHLGLRAVRSRRLIIGHEKLTDAIGVINLLVAFLLITGGLYWSIIAGNALWIALTIMAAIAAGHAATIFFSPNVINVAISSGETSPGETGLALIASVIRVGTIVAGILLGTLPIMVIVMLRHLADAFSGDETLPLNARSFVLTSVAVAGIALLPLLSYLAYLGFRIFLDLYLAIFGISRDLRVLGRHMVSQDALHAMPEDAPPSTE